MPEGSGPRGPDRRHLRALGLARRAGRAVVGTRAVLEAAESGELVLLVLAADASANTVERLAPARRAGGVRSVRGGDKASLGGALGRGPVAVVGVTDAGLAAKVEEELDAERRRAPGNVERRGGKKESVKAADGRRESELN